MNCYTPVPTPHLGEDLGFSGRDPSTGLISIPPTRVDVNPARIQSQTIAPCTGSVRMLVIGPTGVPSPNLPARFSCQPSSSSHCGKQGIHAICSWLSELPRTRNFMRYCSQSLHALQHNMHPRAIAVSSHRTIRNSTIRRPENPSAVSSLG